MIASNYDLMQLYSPSMSVQTKQKINWTIQHFEYLFDKTEMDLMMLEDGISENSWLDLITTFKSLCLKSAKLEKAQ